MMTAVLYTAIARDGANVEVMFCKASVRKNPTSRFSVDSGVWLAGQGTVILQTHLLAHRATIFGLLQSPNIPPN